MRSPERSPPVTSWREGTLRRTSSTSANSAPATVKRHATSVAGGTAATLSRIATNVPPQRSVAATIAATALRSAERALITRASSARQVAMFQRGEVDYLVAPDATGVGLNMAVPPVALGGREKSAGRRDRRRGSRPCLG